MKYLKISAAFSAFKATGILVKTRFRFHPYNLRTEVFLKIGEFCNILSKHVVAYLYSDFQRFDCTQIDF